MTTHNRGIDCEQSLTHFLNILYQQKIKILLDELLNHEQVLNEMSQESQQRRNRLDEMEAQLHQFHAEEQARQHARQPEPPFAEELQRKYQETAAAMNERINARKQAIPVVAEEPAVKAFPWRKAGLIGAGVAGAADEPLDPPLLAATALPLPLNGTLMIWPTRNAVAGVPGLALWILPVVVPKWRAMPE